MEASSIQESAQYKARKEAFVSDLTGGSLTEINLVTLVAPAAILLWTALQARLTFFTPYSPLAFTVEFLLNVCAVLFAITAYASAPVLLLLFLAVPALVLSLPTSGKKASPSKRPTSTKKAKSPVTKDAISTHQAYITNYRGGMLIITALAILAVDFPIFPRRFAKAENWGTSLMDLGVGSFVFSAGVVSARALLRARLAKPAPPIYIRIGTSLRHALPLFVLGFIRLYTVKGLDYAEHVTEYGVHWNFFFTLALLPPFVELSDLLTAGLRMSHALLALVITAVYEIVLNTTTLKPYILVSPRGPGLLSKNREGIFSFAGYLAIFLAGRDLGARVMRPRSAVDSKSKATPSTITHLATSSAICATLYFLSTSYHVLNLTVSRRLANLPYVLWVVAFNHVQILILYLIESGYSSENSETEHIGCSRVMQAFNHNGLVVFLVANLLTGLVNMTLNTLDASGLQAMGVLVAYAAAVTGIAVGLEGLGWRIRL